MIIVFKVRLFKNASNTKTVCKQPTKFIGLAYIAFLFEILNLGMEKIFIYQQSEKENDKNEKVH